MWSSLNIDGFIGSNLMQHAIWDIDFTKKQITITDNELNLNLPKKIIENKLFIRIAGAPSIACKINEKKVWNFAVDFGYNGGIVIPFTEFEKQIEDGQISDFNKFKTYATVGVYGGQDVKKEFYKENNIPEEHLDHPYMTLYYINPIASALRKLDGFKYPTEYYKSFAWDGLRIWDVSGLLKMEEAKKYSDYRAIVNSNTSLSCE